MRLIPTCISITLLLSCQSPEPKKSAEKPTLKKTLSEVWVEFQASKDPKIKPAYSMPDVFVLPEGGLEVVLDRPLRVGQVDFVFEQSDLYRLELRHGDTLHTSYEVRSPMVTAPDDLFPAEYMLPDSSSSRFTDNIRIVPDSGDGTYRAGHLSILSND